MLRFQGPQNKQKSNARTQIENIAILGKMKGFTLFKQSLIHLTI